MLQGPHLRVYLSGVSCAPFLDPWQALEALVDHYPPLWRLLVDEKLDVEPPDVQSKSSERYGNNQTDPPVGCDSHRIPAIFVVGIVDKGRGKEILSQK